MSRPICVLTIIYIAIIIGLHLIGVVFLEFDKVPLHINEDVEYEGTIIEECAEKKYKREYIIKLKSKDKILNNKNFILTIKKKNNIKLNYGDKIKFKGSFAMPEVQRNYGGFDYSLYLKTKKIYGTFNIEQVKVISNNNTTAIEKSIYNFKKYIQNTLEEKLGKNESALCIGLMIGDKTNISDEVQENFRSSNLTHMLAISGAHFSYIILIMTYINKVIKRKRLGQVLMLIGIILFMKITGNTASVMRAGITAIMMIIASFYYKRTDSWNNLAISLLIQVINNPYIIFDIGLQLSYGGVIGILLFYRRIDKKICKKIKGSLIIRIAHSISLTISANIVIIPIMMLNFNTISLTFIVSNLVASPLLGIIIIATFLLIFSSLIFKSILNPLWSILNLLLKILLKITEVCANLPLAKIYVATPNIILVILFYILLLIIRKFKKKSVSIMLIIVILLNFVIPISSSKRKYPEINFIDVGQGDSTLIRVNNKNILIDGGGSMETETFDVGEKTLFPYLLDRGIYALDYVMVSHFDADHSQGLEYVMKNMKVKNAVISSLGQESKEYTTFINLAKRQKTNLIYVKKGDVIKIGNCIIEILYPDNEEIVENRKNNNAIVSKITWKEYSILFTGDIEEKAEKKILNMYENNLEKLESTIIKVGHHGSKTSSTEAFIQAVKPKIALIGVGKNNKFGHPNENVLERLKNIGCKIYRTDIHGEITVKLNSTVKVFTKLQIRNSNKKYRNVKK